ncbi:ATPase/GTPase, AAA15 family [Algoriphagus locisalis]|uniref:ATPase/GTPase, AAA15 family n=1 Tax=Algoriphagus locisalis TaxID=305507 RepID=A0A1I7E4U2_9BACT|nr:ATP-binding protein [Algoriphagus locisalis]SFU18919.1 ATPase/GTPase, AAA15 family [Algoriphagus locisalis]
MILNFSVQNFGPVKEKQILSFEADSSTHLEDQYVITTQSGIRVLKLGLIYGANASGKTTILRALDFLRDLVLEPEEKKTAQLKFSPFLFDQDTPHNPSILSIEFIQKEIKYAYTVEFNKEAVLTEELTYFNPNKANIFRRTTDVENQFTEIKFGSKITVDKVYKKTLESNTLWNNTVLGGYLKTNIQINELRNVADWFEKHLKSLVLTNTELDTYVMGNISEKKIVKNDITNILRRAGFNISDIVIDEKEEDIPDELLEMFKERLKNKQVSLNDLINRGKVTALNLEFEHTVGGAKYSLPFLSESQGTQRYFGFAGLLAMMIKGSVIFPIDELETSLHPDLYNHFILSFLMNTKNSQLIATTHNREILDNRDIYRNDTIWFTDKNEDSATELYSLADFDSSVIRNTSSVYNAYKIGKLGGVPNTGDFYIDLNDEK